MEITASWWARGISFSWTHDLNHEFVIQVMWWFDKRENGDRGLNRSDSNVTQYVFRTTHLILKYHKVHRRLFLRHESQPKIPWNNHFPTCTAWVNRRVFKPLVFALSAVSVAVENIFPIKKSVSFPNLQPLFLVGIHTLGQIANLRKHVDFHDGRHIVVLGAWGEPVVNTTPRPFQYFMHRLNRTGSKCTMPGAPEKERVGWHHDEVRREEWEGDP